MSQFKPYTSREIKDLKRIMIIEDRIVREKEIEKFCNASDRTNMGVSAKLFAMRKEAGMVKPRKNSQVATISNNEFIIPVKTYELRQVNGELNIVIKF